MDDSKLEHLARQLGADAAERIDAERVSAAVLRRLREEPVVRVAWWRRAAVVRIAAALVLFVAGAFALRGVKGGGENGGEVEAGVPYALDELSVTELHEVLDSLYIQSPVYEITAASLYDLDEAQLAELLESLEG